MATATYTSTVFAAPPKNIHAGDQSVSGAMFWTAASTVGDIGFLAKVPNGAKIVDFQEWHSTGATAQGLSFGFDRGIAAGGAGNASVLIASGAQATNNRMTMANMPITISLSDLDPVKYAILIAKVESGTTTTSLNVVFRLTYRMDGPDPV
jgi:hypothetical protein